MNTIPVVYNLFIHLANSEWGNVVMDRVAKEALEDPHYAHHQPLVVTVYEHAGWFLCYTKIDDEVMTVGSANDGAAWHGKAATFRATTRGADWKNIGNIRRGQ